MKSTTLSILLLLVGIYSCRSEALEKRFGPDLERGYRDHREYGKRSGDFKNRDRSNYLGAEKQVAPAPGSPKPDLQGAPALGMQR
ncbi:MAG: hypothetical protein HZA66_18970 [Rhodopseudomonas palustris]|uniref:Lipoprotein n=1 Tax=Rhodopseudomonas palustris TaxID=1076 RepID=A0A933W2X1_RHOPL|nr:hypothetical protein [Rhodopseudomonas palustris]